MDYSRLHWTVGRFSISFPKSLYIIIVRHPNWPLTSRGTSTKRTSWVLLVSSACIKKAPSSILHLQFNNECFQASSVVVFSCHVLPRSKRCLACPQQVEEGSSGIWYYTELLFTIPKNKKGKKERDESNPLSLRVCLQQLWLMEISILRFIYMCPCDSVICCSMYNHYYGKLLLETDGGTGLYLCVLKINERWAKIQLPREIVLPNLQIRFKKSKTKHS